LVQKLFGRSARKASSLWSAGQLLHGAQEPPQSMHSSSPFRTPSAQLGAMHVAPTQTRDTQSELTRQCLPVAHFGQKPPPQSTSVSVPFLMSSVHVGIGAASTGGTHALPSQPGAVPASKRGKPQTPATHHRFIQSASTTHR
jgi:hypothetical protein